MASHTRCNGTETNSDARVFVAPVPGQKFHENRGDENFIRSTSAKIAPVLAAAREHQ